MKRWWLVLVLAVHASAAECPAECACVDHKVDCSSRSLTQVPTGGVSPHATIWDLSDNNLTTIRHDTFRALAHTMDLDLSGNQIVNVSFSHMEHVVTINLSRNNISHIEFKHVRLVALYLSHNPHLWLPEHGFELGHLKVLAMKHCGLSHIPDHLFAHARRLEVLELGGNRLTSLETHTFTHLKHLVYLDLSGNKLVALPSALLKHLDASVQVSLEGNPFVCDCRTRHAYASYLAHRNHVHLRCSYSEAQYHFPDFYKDHCSPAEEVRPTASLPRGSPTDHRGVAVAGTLAAILVVAFVVTAAVRLRRNVRRGDLSSQRFSILKGSDEV